MREPRLGIDIGRVIIGGEGADTQFLDGDDASAMATPAVAGAFDAVAELVRLFEANVWLVSKAGPRIQARTRRWLDERGFFDATSLPREHLRFCRERREKAFHASALNLTHFIDDRFDVLRHLEGIVAHRFLFGPQRRPHPPEPTLTHVRDWRALLHAIKGT
ncbi:MAG: hypothetical protein ACXVDD_01835 [Polyangia bacterium]